MEALLYGCMTWAPRRDHYRLLRRTHHRLLLRVIGYRRERSTYRQLSYAQALKKTGCQSVEVTIRQRRLLFAGAMARQPAGRLLKRLMDGKLVGGESQARDARSRIGWIVSRTTSKRSEPQTALRWTTGSHSELTEPYEPLRRRWTMGRRGTRGCCRERKSSWPPGTRKKRGPADDVRSNGTLVILSPPHICR